MTPHRSRTPESTAQRWAAAAIGTLFVVCAAAIGALFPLTDWSAMLAMGVLLWLGIDALWAACKARPSLLSRLGPLP